MISCLRRFSLLIAVTLLLASCASVDTRFANQEHRQHPGMDVFLDYMEASQKSESLDDVRQYFSSQAKRTIDTTKGWHKLTVTSSYRGLKNGQCDEISILSQTNSLILVSCKGPFTFRSVFGYQSDETMHLRVNVSYDRVQDGWFIYNSGLTHTMGGGESVSRSTGIKFK